MKLCIQLPPVTSKTQKKYEMKGASVMQSKSESLLVKKTKQKTNKQTESVVDCTVLDKNSLLVRTLGDFRPGWYGLVSSL